MERSLQELVAHVGQMVATWSRVYGGPDPAHLASSSRATTCGGLTPCPWELRWAVAPVTRHEPNWVWQRAGDRCEYCQMPQSRDPIPFEIDHIIAENHKARQRQATFVYAASHWKSQT